MILILITLIRVNVKLTFIIKVNILAFRQKTEKHEEERDLVESDSETNVESGAFCQRFEEILGLESDLFYNTEEFKMPGLPGPRRCLEVWQQKK